MANTKPEVFIIESLRLADEEGQMQEGEIITRMLRLSGKPDTKYYYIRTKRELGKMVDIFDESRYRYLHISCHANSTSMATTFDDVTFDELSELLVPCLDGRRVFVSACEMSNEKLARRLLRGTGCLSIIGPSKAINFADAAAFWVSFYHLMFKANERGMGRKDLRQCVRELAALYDVPINYFTSSKSASRGYRRVRRKKI